MVRRAPARILPANCISHLARPRSRRWNTWLQQRELQVDDLCKDIKSGEMGLMLLEELTGEPVRSADGVYPIRITEPSELVGKLLPVMQVGLHAATLVNGVSGVVRMFGYPFPSVPEKLREGAERSVEVLKQESSVEKFGAIHEHVETQDEQATSVRGASLRELEKFLAKEDPRSTYAGLQKVGDDSDGTAVWTTLTDPREVQEALKTRAASRRWRCCRRCAPRTARTPAPAATRSSAARRWRRRRGSAR